MGLHRRIERAEDARAHLGREPPVQHHGAVVLVPEGEATILVLGIGPLGAMRRVRDAFIWPYEMGSDHCPVGVDVED